MEAVKIVNLTKKYKNAAVVDNLNLSVSKGELFSLLGLNGAGKTTTIKMLTCLLPPSSGDAFINGASITRSQDKIKSVIAVSPQETAVAPNLSARENLVLMARLHGLSKSEALKKAAEAEQKLKLCEVSKKAAKKLSGGYQRRLSIAMALICDPEILFLDEPTLGLDVLARNELWDIILELKRKATIILTTHYLEEAEKLSDRIGIMKKGRLICVGTSDAIIKTAGAQSFEQAFISLAKNG